MPPNSPDRVLLHGVSNFHPIQTQLARDLSHVHACFETIFKNENRKTSISYGIYRSNQTAVTPITHSITCL